MDWRQWFGWVAVGSVATLLACLTRAAGLPLALAAAVWLTLRGRRRILGVGLLLTIAGPPLIAWAIWQASAEGSATYTSYLRAVDPYRPELGWVGARGLFSRVLQNVIAYTLTQLSALLTGLGRWPLAAAFGVSVVVTSLPAWARRLRRPGVAELFLPMYLVVILVWPAQWVTDRFLLPVLPLFLFYTAEGLNYLGVCIRHPRLLLASALLTVATAEAAKAVKESQRAAECRAAYAAGDPYACHPVEWAELYRLAEQVRGKLPEGSVVLSRKPTLFWAISGYNSRLYPLIADPDALFLSARETGADYVAVDRSPESERYLRRLLNSRPAAFCRVQGFGSGDTVLVRLETAGRAERQETGGATPPPCAPPPE